MWQSPVIHLTFHSLVVDFKPFMGHLFSDQEVYLVATLGPGAVNRYRVGLEMPFICADDRYSSVIDFQAL